jgi:Zn-dependent protease
MPGAFDQEPFPFGPEHLERLELADDPEGTLATYTWRGETATLWQFLRLWWAFHKYLQRFALYCESDCVVTETRSSGPLWTGLALSIAAIGSFVLMFGWLFGVLFAAILVVHEVGHWLAMRISGQPAPRLMLIPFFGGLAVASHPHKTLFNDAFSALMGAGFSVVPSLLFLLVALEIGDGDLSESWKAMRRDGVLSADSAAAGAAVLAMLTGLVNLFQLLPVLPLDGGQILRTVVQSVVGGWTGRILLGATVGGAAAFAIVGDFLAAGVIGVGALQAWHLGNRPSEAAPMSVLGLLVIGAGYGLTIAAHLAAFVYGAKWLGLDALGLIAGYAGAAA